MGVIEQHSQRRARRMQLQRALALVLFRMSAKSVSLSVATTPEVIRYLKLDDHPSVTRRVHQAIQRMVRKGLVDRSGEGSKRRVTLTTKGERLAERLDKMERLTFQRPRRWDGKWRIVIFDVWEYRRTVRDQLRRMLIRAGFYKLQDSVWVYPYDCEDLLVFLRADLQLGKSVLYVIAEGIENDGSLRAHFDL